MADKIKHLEGKFSVARYELIIACTPEELQLYLFIKLHAVAKHDAFPGFRLIHDQLGWSNDKISATFRGMEQRGRLLIDRVTGQSNLYDIRWYDRLNESGKDKNRSGSRSTTAPAVGAHTAPAVGAEQKGMQTKRKETTATELSQREPVDIQEKIKQYLEDKDYRFRIMAMFWQKNEKHVSAIQDKDQFHAAKNRLMRPVRLFFRRLSGPYTVDSLLYPLSHIEGIMDLANTWDVEDWGLEAIARNLHQDPGGKKVRFVDINKTEAMKTILKQNGKN